MTRRDALREGVRILAEDGAGASDSPSLDASLLLAAALATTKEGLLASLPEALPETSYAAYRGLVERRRQGVPIAYILGHKAFWGHDFIVDPRVLIPRPDTELLVELGLSLGDGLGRPLSCHEACTGSGCVALSLALERPAWRVSASDLSQDALAVAKANAASLVSSGRPGGPVDFFQANLLEPLDATPSTGKLVRAESGRAGFCEANPGKAGIGYDLVLANPPYVESPEAQDLSTQWGEPLLALDGGADGLDPYRRLIPQAFAALAPGGWLLVEADPSQAEALTLLFTEAGFSAIKSEHDLAGLARVTLGRKSWAT